MMEDGAIRYSCLECSRKFPTQRGVVVHHARNHGPHANVMPERAEARLNYRTPNKPRGARKPKPKKYKPRRVSCTICNTIWQNKRSLSNHLSRGHHFHEGISAMRALGEAERAFLLDEYLHRTRKAGTKPSQIPSKPRSPEIGTTTRSTYTTDTVLKSRQTIKTDTPPPLQTWVDETAIDLLQQAADSILQPLTVEVRVRIMKAFIEQFVESMVKKA